MSRCAFFTTSGTCCHPENPDKGSVAATPEQADDACPHCKGSGWEPNDPASCSWCEGTKTWRPDPPSEPTTEEAFARIRTALQEHGFVSAALRSAPGHQSATTGLTALALLERRMQDNPQLAVLVEAFCSEVEAAQASRDARAKGGQHVPAHGGLAHLPASAATSLGRWARDFREAMKK